MTDDLIKLAERVERLNYGIRTGLPTSMAEIHRRSSSRPLKGADHAG